MYINSETGDQVSVEEMQKYAESAGVSVEAYAKAAGFTLQSGSTANDPKPKIKDGNLLDPNFQQGAAADAGVVQPMTASQGGVCRTKRYGVTFGRYFFGFTRSCT